MRPSNDDRSLMRLVELEIGLGKFRLKGHLHQANNSIVFDYLLRTRSM